MRAEDELAAAALPIFEGLAKSSVRVLSTGPNSIRLAKGRDPNQRDASTPKG